MNPQSVSKIVTKLPKERLEEELKLITKDQEKKEKGNTHSPIVPSVLLLRRAW